MPKADLPLRPILKWLEHQRFIIDRYQEGEGVTPPNQDDVGMVARLVTEVQSLRAQLATMNLRLKETKSHSLMLDRGWDTGAVRWVLKNPRVGFRLTCRGCGIALGPTMKSKEDNDDKA